MRGPKLEDELEPVVAVPERRRLGVWSWLVGLSCLSVALLGLTAAAMFFAEFVATDDDALQLLQAALLSFGVGSLLVVPFALAGLMALRSEVGRPRLVTFLMVPWILVGALWIAVGRFDPLIGAVPGIVAALAVWRAWKWSGRS